MCHAASVIEPSIFIACLFAALAVRRLSTLRAPPRPGKAAAISGSVPAKTSFSRFGCGSEVSDVSVCPLLFAIWLEEVVFDSLVWVSYSSGPLGR